MHDIKSIRDNPAAFDQGLALRGLAALSVELLKIDSEKRDHIQKLQDAQARRNALSKEIGEVMRSVDKVKADIRVDINLDVQQTAEATAKAVVEKMAEYFKSIDVKVQQIKDQNANPTTFKKPDYTRSLAALSIGGPIIRDKADIFASYEGNYQNRSNRVNIVTPPTGFPALDSVNLTQYNGTFGSPFRENLFFGKLSDAINDKSSAEVSTIREPVTAASFIGCSRSTRAATSRYGGA